MRGHYDKEIRRKLRQTMRAPSRVMAMALVFTYSTRDVMCPSYKVTRDRLQSPKGKQQRFVNGCDKLAKKNYSLVSEQASGNFILDEYTFSKKPDFSHE